MIETFDDRFPLYIDMLLWNIETDEMCIVIEQEQHKILNTSSDTALFVTAKSQILRKNMD